MSEVVIVRKRNAKTDPPEEGTWAMTDAGPLCRGAKCWFRGYNDPVPDPSVWYDLRATEGEPLTVDDLEAAHDAAQMLTGSDFHKRHWPRMYRCQDRLRAALDALDTRNGDNGGQSN